jgi:hypothetical protein
VFPKISQYLNIPDLSFFAEKSTIIQQGISSVSKFGHKVSDYFFGEKAEKRGLNVNNLLKENTKVPYFGLNPTKNGNEDNDLRRRLKKLSKIKL